MSLTALTYVRHLDTGQVGIDTGFAGGTRICVDGVWHDRARWVLATEAEWNEAHRPNRVLRSIAADRAAR